MKDQPNSESLRQPGHKEELLAGKKPGWKRKYGYSWTSLSAEQALAATAANQAKTVRPGESLIYS